MLSNPGDVPIHPALQELPAVSTDVSVGVELSVTRQESWIT
jgi:hypothetical protein